MTRSMTTTQYRQVIADEMPEDTLQARVEELAVELGWLIYHTYDSRRSRAGFPDVVMIRGNRIMWRELKAAKGEVSEEQRTWIEALTKARADVGVWRPAHLLDGTILAELRAVEPRPGARLLGEAADLVVGTRFATVPFLRRKLRVELERAGDLMDHLEVLGIVGPANGSKAREVLVSSLKRASELVRRGEAEDQEAG